MTKILDGKALSALIRGEIKENLAKFYEKTDKRCALAVVLVGEDPASQIADREHAGRSRGRSKKIMRRRNRRRRFGAIAFAETFRRKTYSCDYSAI